MTRAKATSSSRKTPKPLPPKGDALSQRKLDSRAEDSRLIAAAIAGNQPAYRTLMKKYHDPICNLLYRMIHDKDEVEDLTQEAFIKAFQSLSSFNEEFAF